MTLVKICGLSEVEHAVVAAECGAEFIGMVFARSRRQITPEQAWRITEAVRDLKPCPEIVGVFANQTTQDVNDIAEFCKLDWVQLSGGESWHYCQEIEWPIIKVIHAWADRTSRDIITEIESGYQIYSDQRLLFLLDSPPKEGAGGTGQQFDWQIAREVAAEYPIFVAGGLTPENVGELVRLAHPHGVDVSSGTESDGRKDPAKIKAFVAATKNAR